MAQRPAVPPARAGGLLCVNGCWMRVREGWARAGEPALLASEGMDAENEPASSERKAGCRERASGRHGTGPPRASAVVNADWAFWRCTVCGDLGRDGPTARRPWVLANRWLVGGERGLGELLVGISAGFRGHLSPNGPPSHRLAPGGFYWEAAFRWPLLGSGVQVAARASCSKIPRIRACPRRPRHATTSGSRLRGRLGVTSDARPP